MYDYAFRFPQDFMLGTANSAFQSEGAWNRDGKSESIMDYFAREYAGSFVPGIVKSGFTMTDELPEDGCFFYDNYEAYIEDMKKTGQDTFRMSLAWSRIIPDGTGEVNPKAISFYNKVIDKLLACGIKPFVDLYHWDMPMCLYERGGFTCEKFMDWFEEYARVCFQNFGDRVKLWSTFNEACVAINTGYIRGRFPPFKKDLKEGLLAGHHLILAHYRAVRLYKSMQLGGKIGAVNAIMPVYPAELNEQDFGAARRQGELRFDWWMDPMVYGVYPCRLLEECPKYREAMPINYAQELSDNFIEMDFVGLNYYSVGRSSYDPNSDVLSKRVENVFAQKDYHFDIYPAGLLDSLLYVRDKYRNIEMYISENGLMRFNSGDEETEINDEDRVAFIREHLRMLVRAIRAGVNVKGYYHWNDADSYEELSGYEKIMGLTWVDRQTGRRTWKKSRYYYQKICQTRMVD